MEKETRGFSHDGLIVDGGHEQREGGVHVRELSATIDDQAQQCGLKGLLGRRW